MELWHQTAYAPDLAHQYVTNFHIAVTGWMNGLYQVAAEAINPTIQSQGLAWPTILPLPDELPACNHSLAVTLHHHLFHWLQEMRQYYAPLRYTSIALPNCMVPPIVDGLNHQLDRLISSLKKAHADGSILKAMRDSLRTFINQYGESFTYSRFAYLKYVLSHFSDFVRQRKRLEDTGELIHALTIVNLNTDAVISACLDWLRGVHHSEEEGDQELIPQSTHRLKQILARLKQIAPRQLCRAKRSMPALSQVLQICIEEELAWRALPHSEREGQRIETTLKIGHLAFLIRLFVEIGALRKDNQASLLRLFCQYFQSTDSGELSIDSMRARYYSVERSTVKYIRDLLLQMVRQTHAFPK